MRGEPGDGSAGVPDLAQLPWRPGDAGPVLLVSATRRITFDRARLAFVAFMFAFTYVVGLGVTTGYAVSGAHWVGGQLTSLISATLVGALTFFCAFIAPRPPGTARLLVCHRGLVVYARRAARSPYVVPYLTIDPASVLVRNRSRAYQSISFLGLDPAPGGRGRPGERAAAGSQSFGGVPVTRWLIDTAQPERVLRELERAMLSAGVPGARGLTDRALGEWETAEPQRPRRTRADPDYRPHHSRNPPGPLTQGFASMPEGARWTAYLTGLLGLDFVFGFLVGLLRLPVRFIRLMGQGARGSAKAGGDAPGRARRR
jgi:hypothetical protein